MPWIENENLSQSCHSARHFKLMSLLTILNCKEWKKKSHRTFKKIIFLKIHTVKRKLVWFANFNQERYFLQITHHTVGHKGSAHNLQSHCIILQPVNSTDLKHLQITPTTKAPFSTSRIKLHYVPSPRQKGIEGPLLLFITIECICPVAHCLREYPGHFSRTFSCLVSDPEMDACVPLLTNTLAVLAPPCCIPASSQARPGPCSAAQSPRPHKGRAATSELLLAPRKIICPKRQTQPRQCPWYQSLSSLL